MYFCNWFPFILSQYEIAIMFFDHGNIVLLVDNLFTFDKHVRGKTILYRISNNRTAMKINK